jgi:hypothetical protein
LIIIGNHSLSACATPRLRSPDQLMNISKPTPFEQNLQSARRRIHRERAGRPQVPFKSFDTPVPSRITTNSPAPLSRATVTIPARSECPAKHEGSSPSFATQRWTAPADRPPTDRQTHYLSGRTAPGEQRTIPAPAHTDPLAKRTHGRNLGRPSPKNSDHPTLPRLISLGARYGHRYALRTRRQIRQLQPRQLASPHARRKPKHHQGPIAEMKF